jgi:glutathione peroxidase
MKILVIASLLSVMLSGAAFYDFKVPSLDGKEIDFSKFKGKKVLIVNTASQCGNTPQAPTKKSGNSAKRITELRS